MGGGFGSILGLILLAGLAVGIYLFIKNAVLSKKPAGQQTTGDMPLMNKRYGFMVDESETTIVELGHHYLQSYLLDKSITKGFAVVSQLRVYFNGKTYFANHRGKLKNQTQEKVVDLKDITSTGFISRRSLFKMIASLLMIVIGCISLLFFLISIAAMISGGMVALYALFGTLLLALLAPYGFILYKRSRATYFNIEFAGGNISFDTSWYNNAEVERFQMLLRKSMAEVKDKAPAYSVPIIQAQAAPIPSTSKDKDKIESLREYAKLRDEGIISEEEFQSMKDKLISKED